MTDLDATLAAIDAAIGCQHCAGPLDGSPSPDFCSDTCQTAWHAARADPPPAREQIRASREGAEAGVALDSWMATLNRTAQQAAARSWSPLLAALRRLGTRR